MCFNLEMDRLTLEPIGFVRTGKDLKFQTPHQPDVDSKETNLIELLPGKNFELALQDLEGFEFIWLVWWFHRNDTWRPRVIPPRGPAVRRGVFATRAPHRPNPIGLTSVRLLCVEGLTLKVGPLDLVDGTPILDIKPYIPSIDAHLDAKAGWVDETNRNLREADRFDVRWSDEAEATLPEDLHDRVHELLSIDPTPHRTRRILKLKDGTHRLACGPWRVYFTSSDRVITIREVKHIE